MELDPAFIALEYALLQRRDDVKRNDRTIWEFVRLVKLFRVSSIGWSIRESASHATYLSSIASACCCTVV
jgi:hypothetical protein